MFTQPFIQEQIKETSKLPVTGLCEGNSLVTGEFPAQGASNVENVPFDDVIMIELNLAALWRQLTITCDFCMVGTVAPIVLLKWA